MVSINRNFYYEPRDVFSFKPLPTAISFLNELNSLTPDRCRRAPGWWVEVEVVLAYLEAEVYAIPDECRTLILQAQERDALCHTCIECS
jgi:hypothetical protein